MYNNMLTSLPADLFAGHGSALNRRALCMGALLVLLLARGLCLLRPPHPRGRYLLLLMNSLTVLDSNIFADLSSLG